MLCGYVPTRISKGEQPAGMSPGTMGTGSPIVTPVSGSGGQSLCAAPRGARDAKRTAVGAECGNHCVRKKLGIVMGYSSDWESISIII